MTEDNQLADGLVDGLVNGLVDGGAARPTRIKRADGGGEWDLTWLDDAACADAAVDDFWVEAGRTASETTLNTCRSCPVRENCLRHAYEMNIPGGYFGGLSPGQRRALSLERALVYIQTDTPKPVRNLPSRRRRGEGLETPAQ